MKRTFTTDSASAQKYFFIFYFLEKHYKIVGTLFHKSHHECKFEYITLKRMLISIHALKWNVGELVLMTVS